MCRNKLHCLPLRSLNIFLVLWSVTFIPKGNFVTLQSASASSATVVLKQCTTITTPGNYQLGTHLTAAGDCIKIKTDSVNLDCAEYQLRGTRFKGAGIAIQRYGFLNSQIPSDIEIHNCNVSGFHYGILAESGNHLFIHHNDTSYNYDDTAPLTRHGIFLGVVEGGGIRLNHAFDSEISDNIANGQAIGVNVQFSNNIIVRNNTASNNSAWGIHFWSTRNSQVIGNRVANNIRQCTWGSGVTDWGCDAAGIILQMGSSHNLITDNWVAGRNGNGIFLKAHDQPCGNDNQIVGNTIEDDFYNGIELSFCSRNNIIGNQIRGGFDGIWIGFARDSEIRDNTFMNLKNHGIVSPNSQRIVISGNRFINTNEGVSFFSWEENDFDWLPSGDYTSQNNCFVGNTFRSNAIAIHLKNSRNNQFADNVFQGNGLNILAELQKGGKYVRRELDDGPIPFLDDDYDRWGSEK